MVQFVDISARGAVAIIRLNRSNKRNALTREMYRDLTAHLSASDRDPAIGVRVLLGSDGQFCAGHDIADFQDAASGAADLPVEILQFIETLITSEKPLIAAVEGHAVGIGTTLLLHCDLVYAAPDAKFSTPFLDLGLVPEAASTFLMPARIGYQRAFEMLALGEIFTAERACACGLINAIVPAPELETHTVAIAQRLAAKPAAALAATRRLMRPDTAIILKRMREEAEEFAACLTSPAAREAFARFLSARSKQ